MSQPPQTKKTQKYELAGDRLHILIDKILEKVDSIRYLKKINAQGFMKDYFEAIQSEGPKKSI